MVEEQCGFRRGRSCTDAIFTVQQIIEKRKERNLPLFHFDMHMSWAERMEKEKLRPQHRDVIASDTGTCMM